MSKNYKRILSFVLILCLVVSITQVVLADENFEVLPSSHDNSTSKYFPEVGNQAWVGACASYATTHHQYTYYVNKLNNIETTKENTACPLWTYNLINHGSYSGGSIEENYEILKTFGCPTYGDYLDVGFDAYEDKSYTYWLNNEEAQINALKTRIKETHKTSVSLQDGVAITFNTGEETDYAFDRIKEQLCSGEIFVISGFDNWQINIIQEDYHSGEKIIYANAKSEQYHPITIVGYDDNIAYDANNNGSIEAYERGAFKIANSWGASWGNDGYIWALYDAFNYVSQNNIDINGNRVGLNQEKENNLEFHYFEVENYDCDLVGKISFSTKNRHDLSISASKSNSVGHSNFEYIFSGSSENKHSYNGSIFFDTFSKIQETISYDFTIQLKGKTFNENYAYDYAKFYIVDSMNNTLEYLGSIENVNDNFYHGVTGRLNLYSGDLNFDNSVTEADVDVLTDYLNGNLQISSAQKFVSDLNDDKRINASDLLILYKMSIDNIEGVSKGIYEITPSKIDLNDYYKLVVKSKDSTIVSLDSDHDHLKAGFLFEPVSDGYYVIKSVYNEDFRWAVMPIFGEAETLFELKLVPSSDIDDSQLFRLVKQSEGVYKIISKINGKYLSSSYSEDNASGEIVFSNPNDDLNQVWNIKESLIVKGDTDMNLKFSPKDIIVIENYIAGFSNTEIGKYLADVDCNDVVDSVDINIMKEKIGDYYFTSNGINYMAISTDEMQVSNYLNVDGTTNYSGTYIIPSYVYDKISFFDVVKIGTEAFKNCSEITKVVLPNTVHTIDSKAFSNCINLKHISLSEKITNIADDAFEGVEGLTIYGKANSYAEQYANEHNINFAIILYDWENENVGATSSEVAGFTSDTMVWRGEFVVSDNEYPLSQISTKGIAITNTIGVPKTLRAALKLKSGWMNECTKMKIWVGHFNGTVTIEFRGPDSMSYKRWIGTSSDGWLEIDFTQKLYKNGPDNWEYTYVDLEEMKSAHTLWISFENQSYESTVYLDEIVMTNN